MLEVMVRCAVCGEVLAVVREGRLRSHHRCRHWVWLPRAEVEALGLGGLQAYDAGELLLFQREALVERLRSKRNELLRELREADREVRRLTGASADFAVDVVKYWLEGERDWPAALRRWGYVRWAENFDEAMAAIERYKSLSGKVRKLDDLIWSLTSASP